MSLETVFAIDDFLPFLYIIICLVSVAHFQMTTSLSLLTTVICIAEFANNAVRSPVWDSLPYLDPDIARIVWTGLWVSINFITVWVVYRIHVWRNIAISTEAYAFNWLLITQNILITLRYLSAITVKSEYYAIFYQYIIPISNVGLGIYLIFALIRNLYDIRIQARVRRLPL
ncbi:hypothetical protein KIH87_05620 [Paraneptunicella aestuarii]|uniref:hypothetical protein n=1 Tax=Paraneptunicella aestuarii TaxID=2831148 RepID=UPI001E5CB794|nr:hypothetical protein [Paraneptunicella aestuarii]UAA39833.1 hypothetical protein KIH87_05620 [Paraneptunicella aestuarii]